MVFRDISSLQPARQVNAVVRPCNLLSSVMTMTMSKLTFSEEKADARELKRSLEHVSDIELTLVDPPAGPIHDETLRSDSSLLAIVTVILGSAALPTAINAVRDIIIEHMRLKTCKLEVEKDDGTRLLFIGPMSDDQEIQVLTNAS